MGIALMTDIKYNLVIRRAEHLMQRNRQLDYPEIRGKMSPVFRNSGNHIFTNFSAQRLQFVLVKLFNILWRIDMFKKHLLISILYSQRQLTGNVPYFSLEIRYSARAATKSLLSKTFR